MARLQSRCEHHHFDLMMIRHCVVSLSAPSRIVAVVLGFDVKAAPVCLAVMVIHYVLLRV